MEDGNVVFNRSLVLNSVGSVTYSLNKKGEEKAMALNESVLHFNWVSESISYIAYNFHRLNKRQLCIFSERLNLRSERLLLAIDLDKLYSYPRFTCYRPIPYCIHHNRTRPFIIHTPEYLKDERHNYGLTAASVNLGNLPSLPSPPRTLSPVPEFPRCPPSISPTPHRREICSPGPDPASNRALLLPTVGYR